MCSEAAFIETFISDKAAIEKGGYLLATFQTCLQFLTRLDSNEMQKNSGDILGIVIFRYQIFRMLVESQLFYVLRIERKRNQMFG